MSGNTKEKIAVRNNASKKTPAATAPMANAYANATKTPRLIAENEAQQIDYTARSLRSDRARTQLGCYVATKLKPSSVAT
ncbi:hypothetical protein F2Q69_00019633 [Brassica cretica]|uniref:Uncharacterized protein n=1 Tax=Brassica cretica TaxID=69181 RepID=A0A8S9Q882_BRACR|nr:hypothetical protein F2Q69_00019633 [Brassica cretica]